MKLTAMAIIMALTSAYSGAHAQPVPQLQCKGTLTDDLGVAENKILLIMDAATLEAFGKSYTALVREHTKLNISQQDALELQKAFFSRKSEDLDRIISKYDGDSDHVDKFNHLSWKILATSAFLRRLVKEFYTKDNFKKTEAMLNDVKVQVVKAIQQQITDTELLKKVLPEIQNAELSWLNENMISKNTVTDEEFGVPVVNDEFLNSDPTLSSLMAIPAGLFQGTAANIPIDRDKYAIFMTPPFFTNLDEGSFLVLAHELGHILSQNILSRNYYKDRVMAYGTCAMRSAYPSYSPSQFTELIDEKANELIADAVATWAIKQGGPNFISKASNILCLKLKTAPLEDERSDSHPGAKIRIEKLFSGKCQL